MSNHNTTSHKSNKNGHGQYKRSRDDSTIITLADGKKIDYHPSFRFPPAVYKKFKPEDNDRLRKERASYNSKKPRQSQSSSSIQALHREIQELKSQVQSQTAMSHSSIGQASSRAPTVPTSIMGGQNEQQTQQSHERNIAAIKTTRNIAATMSSAGKRAMEPLPNVRAHNECDTNADTCCLGTNFTILHYTTRTADVYAYDSSIKPIQGVPIVTGVTAHDSEDGQVYLLVFHESLYYGANLDHSLINPNQLRHHGINVNDNPYDKDHRMGINVDDQLHIPFSMQGTKIFFSTRSPTQSELATCPRITMTNPNAWNPQTVMLSPVASFIPTTTNVYPSRQVQQLITGATHQDIPLRRTFTSTSHHHVATAEELSEHFCIGLHQAQATLHATTQRGT